MDFYKHRLAHAAWTWREHKVHHFFAPSRSKDRRSGRAEKHRARELERAEIEDQRCNTLWPAELRLIEQDAKERDG